MNLKKILDWFEDFEKNVTILGDETRIFWVKTLEEINKGKNLPEKLDILKNRFLKIFKFFGGHKVLILGTRESGKTSLIYYLVGRLNEFEEKGGPTGRPSNEDVRKVEIGGRLEDDFIDIPLDVGGDPKFFPFWRKMVKEIDPLGIIYMIDGSKSEKEIKEDINQVFQSVFITSSEKEIGYLKGLRVLYIFVNFHDKWGEDLDKYNLKDSILSDFKKELVKNRNDLSFDFRKVEIEGHKTQINPNAKEWEDLDRALKLFNKDLTTKKSK